MSHAKIAYGNSAGDTAVLLLDAAQKLDLEPSVIRTTSEPFFHAPIKVAKAAGVEYEVEDDDENDAPEDDEPAKAVKKTAAKKTTSNKE